MSHDADESWCAIDLLTAFVERPDLLLDVSCAASPTALPMPNRAERLRPTREMVETVVDLDDDGQDITIEVPSWWADWREGAVIRWRDLDGFDLTSVVIRGPGSDYDVRDHLPFERVFAEFVEAPGPLTPAGWSRSTLETSAGDLIRYTNDRTGVDVTLHVETWEPEDLEADVLAPLARSIGDGR